MVYAYVPKFVSISLLCRPLVAKNPNLWWRKPPIFTVFWTSAFTGIDNWWQSEKVEHGCTTTNLPLSNGIKIVSVLKRLHGEMGRTNADVQKHDEQTDKKLKVLAAPAAGEIRAHQTWQGDRGP